MLTGYAGAGSMLLDAETTFAGDAREQYDYAVVGGTGRMTAMTHHLALGLAFGSPR